MMKRIAVGRVAMRARHLARQQELDGGDHRVGRRPAAVEAGVEELQRAALLADGHDLAGFAHDATRSATPSTCRGSPCGSGCLVIWLASSQSPYMWAACILSWNSVSAAVAAERFIAISLA